MFKTELKLSMSKTINKLQEQVTRIIYVNLDTIMLKLILFKSTDLKIYKNSNSCYFLTLKTLGIHELIFLISSHNISVNSNIAFPLPW